MMQLVSISGNGIKAEEQGFLKNAGVPDQEAQVIVNQFRLYIHFRWLDLVIAASSK